MSNEGFGVCAYVLSHASLFPHRRQRFCYLVQLCKTQLAPVQPSVRAPLLVWGMNHSSYCSSFSKSSAVPPPRLTDFSFVGKVWHAGILTAGGNAGAETGLGLQQQSPGSSVPEGNWVSVTTNETQPNQHHRAKRTPELRPRRTHAPSAQHFVNRARSVGSRSAPTAPTLLPPPPAQSSPNLS